MLDSLPQIGPYKILAKLGEGGMGIVYKAEDQRLGRAVALKVIREAGDSDQLKKRFLREARLAACIDHPNICRVYDIGEESGYPYLVMELLEGESLATRLTRGAMPPAEAIDVGLAMLAALAALHRNATLHRDLKPSNVFLSKHGVKLLDFGLAKTVSSADDSSPTATDITQPGVIVATPRYASPEQISGKELTARSDLFSAASVMFEMLAGRTAFAGDSALEIFHSILYDSPPSLTGPAAIASIDRVLHRALSKNPADRFGDADAMASELKAARQLEHSGARVEARTVKRLIILPFRQLRPDPDTDFLAFSLPDALAASLAGLSSLVVRSTLAAARFAGPALDLKEIAREADVDVVLTGTLLRAGSQLRLATQLVQAPAGTLIWSGSMQVELSDIFQLQDSLVASVVQSLSLPLTAGERLLLAHDAPASPSAYDLYLRANELARNRSYFEATDMLRKCVEADPAYAPAWARLGRAIWLTDKYSSGSRAKQEEANRAISRALELNHELPLAHHLRALIRVEQGHAKEAMTGLLRRARLFGHDPELFAALQHACRYCGLYDASLAAHRRAHDLDPNVRTTVTQTHFFSGDYEKALETSEDGFGYGTATSLAMLGRIDEAITLLKQRETMAGWRLGQLHLTSLRASLENKAEECAAAADELFAVGFNDPEGWFYLSRQLAYCGQNSKALLALKNSIDGGCWATPAIAADRWFDGLRGDAAFERLLGIARELTASARAEFQAEGGALLLGCEELQS
jgi:serine/threonine protein kinase